MTIFTDLIINVALLLSLSILYSFLTRIWKEGEISRQILAGVLFGGVAVAGMMLPFRYGSGIIFDGRSIVMSMAGLFGGPFTAAISTLIAGGYRFWLGGTGAATGFFVIFTSAALGVGYYYLRRKKPHMTSTLCLLVFGVIVNISMLLCMLTLPWPMAFGVLGKISIPVMLIFPFGMVFLGTLLLDQEEQNDAQEALRKSEDKYRNLFDSLYDIAYQTDSEGITTLISPSVERITGYSPDEVIGRDIREFYVDPQERKRLLEFLATDGHVENFEAQIKCKDNSAKWVSANAKFLKDGHGNFLGVEGILRDVTDPKLAAQALLESEERFRLTFNTSPDAINLNQLKTGVYVDVNEGFTQLTGYTREDVIDRTSMEINIWHDPGDRQKLVDDLQEKGFCENLEAQFRKKDGSLITALMSAKIMSLKGTPHIISITRDIGHMKAAQEAKQELETQLQQSQRMEAIATLAGGVAHEFNNSLVGIIGHIELLKMDFPEDEKVNKSLDTMNIAAYRMSRLTDQLLAYARGGRYQPKNLKLDDFVIETLPILQHGRKSDIRVETHFQKNISYISADNAQMQMVLSAILANSNEAMEHKGLIRITAENQNVDDDFTKQHPGLQPGSYVCLKVEDDGKGMDEETKNGIFEPFFTTKFQGRGMGMAAVYGMVRNHGGWIHVDSELGKGTTVRIYLPAVEIAVE